MYIKACRSHPAGQKTIFMRGGTVLITCQLHHSFLFGFFVIH